ncbi:MAG: hypothetical protein AAGF12_28480 [Myxococcota bacterium]
MPLLDRSVPFLVCPLVAALGCAFTHDRGAEPDSPDDAPLGNPPVGPALLRLPADLVPSDHQNAIEASLHVRGESAVAVGRGGCIGKAPGECPAGRPATIHRGRVESHRTLSNAPTFINAALTSSGTSVFQVFVPGGTPVAMVSRNGVSETVLQDVEGSGALVEAVDGSVLVRTRNAEGTSIYRVQERSAEPLVENQESIDVTVADHAILIAARSEERGRLFALTDDGQFHELIAGDGRVHELIRERAFCVRSGDRGRLALVTDGRLDTETPIELPGMDCEVVTAQLDADEILLFHGQRGAPQEVFRWNPAMQTPAPLLGPVEAPSVFRAATLYYGLSEGEFGLIEDGRIQPMLTVNSRTWRVLSDDQRLAWVELRTIDGVQLLRAMLIAAGQIVHQGEIAAGSNPFLYDQWLAPDGTVWISLREEVGSHFLYSLGPNGLERSLEIQRNNGAQLSFNGPSGIATVDGPDAGIYRIEGQRLTRIGESTGPHVRLLSDDPHRGIDENGDQWIAWENQERWSLGYHREGSVATVTTDLAAEPRALRAADGTQFLLLSEPGGMAVATLQDRTVSIRHRGFERMNPLLRRGAVAGIAAIRGERTWFCRLQDGCTELPFERPRFYAPLSLSDSGNAFALVATRDAPDTVWLWRPQ